MSSITIKINSVQGVTASLFGSNSTANDTNFSWDSASSTATFWSSGSSSGPTIEYLPFTDYSSGSAVDVRYKNSVCLLLSWETGEQTVVLSGNVKSATWFSGSTDILPQKNSSYSAVDGESLTVTPVIASSSSTSSDRVSEVTIGGYWRTGYGPVDGGGQGTPKGTYDDPVCWAAKHGNVDTAPSGTPESDMWQYPTNPVNSKRRVPISWTKPNSSSVGNIQYYIVVGWKGNWGSSLDVATSFLCSKNAQSVLDDTNWWNGAETAGGSFGKILYTIHAVYSDKGVVPSLVDGQTANSQHNRPDWGIWRGFSDHGETLVTLRFYDYNNNSPRILRDATTGLTEFVAIANKSEIKSFIPESGFPQTSSGRYKLVDYWLKKNHADSSYGSTHYSTSNLGSAPGYDLDVAGVFKNPTRKLIFDANGGTCSEQYRDVEVDGQYGTLPTPTRASFNFVGWFTSASGGTQVYATTVMQEGDWSDVIIYAHWEAATRLLKFHPNGDGATCPETQRTVYINERYDKDGALPEAVRNNYRFIGWFTEAVNGNRINDDDIVPQGTTDIHAYAHWTSAWDAEVTLTFLCHKRPKLYLSAKRHSLEQPDAVTLCMKPELETLPQEGDHKDKNFVHSVFNYMQYKVENRTDNSWDGDDVKKAYPDRTAYSDPEYPTWLTFINNDSGPVLTNSRGVFRVDAMNSAKTKFVEFDIDKEYQLRARIWDALGYASEIKYDIPSNPAATYEDDGRKLLYSNDKYCTLSLWSNVALLLKYITKLFVHNPYMDEVLKESRSLSIVEGKPVWGKQLREVSNPPETDFWQIREHIQNSIKDKSKVSDMVDAILKLRSNSASVNGFTTAEVKNLIIPTLKRLLADDENLVYDKSQIKPLVNILYQINDTHSKIAREKDEYTESINYSGLKVGDTAKAAEIDAHTSSSRILELDGERHQTSTHWENESDALENRVKDSLYQSVELKNFENDRDDDVAQSTIDHISNYDISQLDLENSLSDLIYILSRMRPRELNSEGPAANDFNTASRDAYNKSHYWDSTNNKFTANAFSNWIDGVWQTPETDINEYKSSIDGYELLVGTTSLDPNNDYGDNDLKNNGCGAACMGLCESGCYGSCVGSCKTACGDSCFYGCTTSCGAACGSDCTGGCAGTCSGDCSSGCKEGCNETCKGGCKTGCKGSCESGCKGCTASCKTECRGDCGSGCTSGCEAKCKLQCTSSCQGQCKDGCTNHCTTNCFSECGANCTSTCSGGCKGTCSGGCNSNCGNACNQACSSGCGGGCTNSCSTNCGSGCEKNCKGYCYQSCLASCIGECGSSCDVSCVLDCSSGCTSGCTNGCGAYCKQSCTGSCTGDCKNTCSTGCTGSCSSNCAEDCENICFAGCGNSCSSGCLTTCMAGCVGGCQNTCDEGCQGGCGIGCDGGCVSTCYNGCGGNQCKGACSTTCDKQCKQGCAILCYNICNVQCSHACHVDCTHDCREICKLICDNLCENDCEKGCQYYCHGSCREECVNSCQESCFEICSGQCRAECNTFCHTSCQTACGEQCHGECGKTCHSTCSKVCQFNCEELCMTTCNETCEADCGSGCTKGCGTNCTGLCEGNCSSDCGNGCKDGCSTNCTGGCGTGCNQGCLTSCSGGCKSECTTDCEGTCKNGCLSGCYSNCSDACSASCSGNCGGDCEGGCKTGCTGTCGGTCSGTCDSGCKSGCEGSCKTTCTGECVNSCVGGCSDGCGSSCDSSCENSCSNACTHWCTGTAKITA